MSTPTRQQRSPQADRLSVEHSSTYVSRRRGPKLPKPPKVKRPKLPPLPDRARPFGIASAIAAGWAAGMGLIVVGVPVLLVWVTAARTQNDVRAATAFAADAWLAAHHVGFSVGGGARFALLPLGLLVVPFLLLRLSCSWAVRVLRPATLGDAALFTGATALVYGLIGGLVAVVAARPDVSANPFEALAWCGVVAGVCAGWTTVRAADLTGEITERLPRLLRGLAGPAAAGLLTVLAGATLVTLASLVVHGGDVLAVSRALDAGVVGTVALVVLSVLYLPNLIVWAAAFCIGPGFAVGTGTSVTLAGVSSGSLPAFPLFAAIPSSGVPAAPVWLCLLVPLAGGLAVAWWTVRGSVLDPESAALRAGMSGVGAGVGLGVLAWLAGGSLAGGRMSAVGPSPWQVAALAALELGLVAAVAAWTLGWRRNRLPAG